MKEIKQKPAGGKPKTADAARVPKAVVKAAWLQAREAARAGEKQVVGGKDGAYSGAADTGEKGADKLVSTGERVTELAYRGGRKLAERSAGQRRERAKAAQTGGEAAQRHGAGETIAHTSTIEASRPPQTREAGRVSDENRPAGARPQQRESRAVGRAKPIKPGREMKQGAPGPKTTEQAGKARQAVQAAARNGQAKARFTQRAQQTAKRAVDTTKRATDAARAGMRALVEALHSLLIALAAGGSVAVLIVVLICLIAFVAGSAYGIFFAAEAPGEDAFTAGGGAVGRRIPRLLTTNRIHHAARPPGNQSQRRCVLHPLAGRPGGLFFLCVGCGGRRAGGLSGRVAPAATSPNHVGYE